MPHDSKPQDKSRSRRHAACSDVESMNTFEIQTIWSAPRTQIEA